MKKHHERNKYSSWHILYIYLNHSMSVFNRWSRMACCWSFSSGPPRLAGQSRRSRRRRDSDARCICTYFSYIYTHMVRLCIYYKWNTCSSRFIFRMKKEWRRRSSDVVGIHGSMPTFAGGGSSWLSISSRSFSRWAFLALMTLDLPHLAGQNRNPRTKKIPLHIRKQ